MRSRSVSLTGATGFLGGHVARAFRGAGWDVRAIVRPGTRRPVPEGTARVQAALDDPDALARAVDGTTLLVHAAAVIRAPHERAFSEINVEGTRSAVAAANRVGAEFVLISSQAAGGPGTIGRPRREDDPPQPITPYGRSKLAAEEAVRAEARVPWIVARPSAIYGPADRGFLPLFRFASRGLFPLIAPRDTAFTLVDAADVARAVVMAAEDPRTRGETFFVGGDAHTIDEILRGMADALGRRYRPRAIPPALVGAAAAAGDLAWRFGWQFPIDRHRHRELTAGGFVCAVDRAERLFGFRAETALDEGFGRTLAWYRREGWL
jgi:nucleoside-diphosphate-sugar epimerase